MLKTEGYNYLKTLVKFVQIKEYLSRVFIS